MSMNRKIKIAVIGGGAAGLTAAIACARKFGNDSVIVIEKQKKIGRKLSATGNGRCNIGNTYMSEIHYRGDRKIINSVISSFGVNDLKKFFQSMGLIFYEEGGRLYPYSNSASTVVECLTRELAARKVDIVCENSVRSIKNTGSGFIIDSDKMRISSEYLIFATGSKASPSLGADDSGLKLLSQLGICSSKIFPALSPVQTKEKYNILKGVRAKGAVTVYADKKVISRDYGEIQFTGNALSGICVFQGARFVNEFLNYRTILEKHYGHVYISLDVMHDYGHDDLCMYLRKARKVFSDRPIYEILSAALNRKLSEAIVAYSKIKKKYCNELDENDIQRLASCVKDFRFTPVLSDSFKTAQVCAGGIGSKEVDPDTLMSKNVKNLFICGELLDVDGECGGYNLHFAFGSAMKPAKYIR